MVVVICKGFCLTVPVIQVDDLERTNVVAFADGRIKGGTMLVLGLDDLFTVIFTGLVIRVVKVIDEGIINGLIIRVDISVVSKELVGLVLVCTKTLCTRSQTKNSDDAG